MPDIKVVIIGFSLLIIALDRIVPKDNPSYKVITYVVRGIMLVLFGTSRQVSIIKLLWV